MGGGAQRIAAALCGLLLAALSVGVSDASTIGAPVTGPLHRAGRWLVDDQGRVVIEHGVNVIKKVAPYVRTQFSEQDARLLADEGFTAARIGFIWAGVEPQPGVYDDAYVQKVLALDSLLARYGIRTLVDFHQDEWSQQTGGDGAPAWATLASSADQSFAAFWRDQKAPDGVGIQTHFVNAWRHVAGLVAGHRNILGLDPFNEPYPGSDYPPPCSDFSPCPSFESGPLAAFYRRVIAAIRQGGAEQVIYPEAIADSGSATPALPAFDDPQTAYTFHYYCNVTQLDPREAPVSEPSPEAAACAPIEQRNLGTYQDYLRGLGAPGLLGEFSCNDVNRDNAQVIDLVDVAFDSWTIWAYYNAADDPADCPRQGLLVNDSQPGSEANAKQLKLDALVVPHAQAIAGTPTSTSFDRSSRVYTLSYATTAVPGAALAPGALTQIFIPARQYPTGYGVQVSGARVVSAPGAPWLLLSSDPGVARATVQVSPADGATTERPLQTGQLPVANGGDVAAGAGGEGTCSSRRVVVFHLPRGAHLLAALVAGHRVARAAGRRSVRVSLRGRRSGAVRVRIVMLTRAGRRRVRLATLHPCVASGRARSR